jgi:hypothetical protein
MSKTAINRQQEGLVIANIDGAIKRISELKYVVKSQNGNGEYDVCSTDLGWSVLDMIFNYLSKYYNFGFGIAGVRVIFDTCLIARLSSYVCV